MNVKIAFGFGKFSYLCLCVCVCVRRLQLIWILYDDQSIWRLKMWKILFFCFCTSTITLSTVQFCFVSFEFIIYFLIFVVCFCFHIESILDVKHFCFILSFFLFHSTSMQEFWNIFYCYFECKCFIFHTMIQCVLCVRVHVCMIVVKMLNGVF